VDLPPAKAGVLEPQGRWQSSGVGRRERRDSGPYPEHTRLGAHETLASEDIEMDRPWEDATTQCGSSQTEEIGNSSGADDSGPVAPRVRMGRRVADT
jgi:hypothetical protein